MIRCVILCDTESLEHLLCSGLLESLDIYHIPTDIRDKDLAAAGRSHKMNSDAYKGKPTNENFPNNPLHWWCTYRETRKITAMRILLENSDHCNPTSRADCPTQLNLCLCQQTNTKDIAGPSHPCPTLPPVLYSHLPTIHPADQNMVFLELEKYGRQRHR